MIREYATRYYEPASRAVTKRLADGGALGKTLESWESRLTRHWPALRFGHLEATARADAWDISVEVYLDEIVTAGAMPYAKLFDATKVDPKYDDHDIMMLGARMSAYRATMKGGPLAFVVTGGRTHEAIQRYINLASADRAVAVFTTAPEARAWLDAQPKPD